MKTNRAILLLLLLADSSQAVKLRQNNQNKFVVDGLREIAGRAPEMGKLQDKLEKLESL